MRSKFPAIALFAGLIASMPAAAEVPDALVGKWLAEDIRGGGVVDRVQTSIEIDGAGKVFGSGGCNRIGGTVEVKDTSISFGRMAATMMACPPAVMDQEHKFLSALEDVKSWKVEPEQRKLLLLGADGTTLVRLARVDRGAKIEIEVPGADGVERNRVAYDCGRLKIQAEYLNAGPAALATLSLNGEFVVAANVISGSGARYAGGKYVWWTKGREATLQDVTAGEDASAVACTEAG